MSRQSIAVLLFVGLVGMPGLGSSLSAAEPDPSKKLAQVRLEIARKALEAAEKSNATGEINYTWIRLWSRRVLDAELAVAETQDERIAAYEAYRLRCRRLMDVASDGYRRGSFTLLELLDAQYLHADVEYELAQLKAGKEPKPK